ncbi:hypothetical protein G3495_13765 [Shewanella baltica]|nr:hypothetical protein [Shewanella baltica]MCS6236183.1 hypothetical protein [Shewanella baltica]MCS6270704.1 hypothetical protein [Shewanella baltica]
MKKTVNNINPERKFIPHEVAIKRVKDSFERAKKKQEEGFNKFIEVK